ncbi:MAG TPA: hypothetical protein VGF01_04300 [Terracidiphilus sp.]
MNRFFQKLRLYSRVSGIKLDWQNVTFISPEAIAAFIATMESIKGIEVQGNLPYNQDARDTLLCSGFFEHVHNTVPLPTGRTGKILKRGSKRVEPRSALELIECGAKQAFGTMNRSHSTRAAYKTLIELMNNTHNHAAGKKPDTEKWWATSFGNSSRKIVCYSFVDTGVGIFRSVKMRSLQRIFKMIGITSNAEIMQEILNGRVESSTGLAYRGKGLPAIYKAACNGDIKSLYIVSNNMFADIDRSLFVGMTTSFEGTLYYWESEE